MLNIYMTFWAWLAQFITNMFFVLLIKFMFGKDPFVYYVIGFIVLFFTFNVLPFIYIILGNESFKRAILKKK